jgi:hypothetical protein
MYNRNTGEDKLSISPANNVINIYKGKHFVSPSSKKNPNAIVLDLDETLGSFSDLDILHRHLANHISFDKLLDMYPEFFRYGIFPILKYIHNEKIKNKCNHIFIYTNNRSHYDIVGLISAYFSYKMGIKDIFDKIIRSFKIGDTIVEMNRTTQDKTYSDFIRCTLLSKKTKICFVDNTYFPQMENSRVYYIKPMSYHHHLSKEEIMDRVAHLLKSPQEKLALYDKLLTFPNTSVKNFTEYLEMKKNMDKLVAQKMMYHIRDFFFLTCRRLKTRRKLNHFNRLTKKLRT